MSDRSLGRMPPFERAEFSTAALPGSARCAAAGCARLYRLHRQHRHRGRIGDYPLVAVLARGSRPDPSYSMAVAHPGATSSIRKTDALPFGTMYVA